MINRIHQVVRVLPGNRIEIEVPELNEGELVRVELTRLDRSADRREPSIIAFLDSRPPGPRAFTSWDQYEHHLREERSAWEP